MTSKRWTHGSCVDSSKTALVGAAAVVKYVNPPAMTSDACAQGYDGTRLGTCQ